MLYLNDVFDALWDGREPFDEALKLTGEVYRDLGSRRTIRFAVGGRRYFAKIHEGVGWREIFKNLVQLKLPSVSAASEWRAIEKLHAIGIDTMVTAAFGVAGWNPARRRSFVITEALEGVESLEDLFEAPERWKLTARERLAITARIAGISRRMHGEGVNHRDYYLCHLLVDRERLRAAGPENPPRIFVIDLHRAQIRQNTPVRWRVKDIGGLFFSAIGPGLRRADLFRFMRGYSGKGLRQTLAEDAPFWRRVYRRGCRMYRANGREVPAWLEALG